MHGCKIPQCERNLIVVHKVNIVEGIKSHFQMTCRGFTTGTRKKGMDSNKVR
jgi:hypothetical protein